MYYLDDNLGGVNPPRWCTTPSTFRPLDMNLPEDAVDKVVAVWKNNKDICTGIFYYYDCETTYPLVSESCLSEDNIRKELNKSYRKGDYIGYFIIKFSDGNNWLFTYGDNQFEYGTKIN